MLYAKNRNRNMRKSSRMSGKSSGSTSFSAIGDYRPYFCTHTSPRASVLRLRLPVYAAVRATKNAECSSGAIALGWVLRGGISKTAVLKNGGLLATQC